jgi:predicted PurR-regulated permease PerM
VGDRQPAPSGAGLPGELNAVDRRVDEAVDEAVEQRVDEAIEQHVDEALRPVQDEARVAEQAADRAGQSAQTAADARDGARAAGAAAVHAAGAIAPDDPLLDTAVRKLEAKADDEHPFGRPGRPMSSRSPFRIAFTASLGVALAYGLVNALIAVRQVLVLLLIAAFLAIGLNPAVDALEARRLGRGPAVGIVFAALLLFFTGFGLAVVPPIVEQAQSFVEQAPDYIRELQQNDRIADLDERYGLLDRARSLLDRPAALGGSLFGGVLGVGKVVFSAFFSVLTVLILTLYFLSSLPTIKATAYRLVPRSRRARVGLLTDEILTRVGGYVAGAMTIASLAGLATFALLTVLGVQYQLALAMLVAVTALIPLIGATIGATVVTLVALFASVKAGLISAVFFLIYQQVENYVLYPRIMRRSVDVSPAATVVAVLVGGSLLGVLGALLAIPIAAAVQLVLKEVVGPRQDAL